MSTPSGAGIVVDDLSQGETPRTLELEPGPHRLRLERSGYAPAELSIVASAGRELVVAETLRDSTPPQVHLAPLPAHIRSDEGLKVAATAEDDAGVTHMSLILDDKLVARVDEPSLRHNLDTRTLSPGSHQLAVEAADAAGNVGRELATFTLLEPTLEPTPSAEPTVGPSPEVTAGPTLPPQATATAPAATADPREAVSVTWGEVSISTYGYEQALYTDPEKAGHPYPLLRREQVGPPRPRTYKVLVLRSAYLELTLMPQLGGRIYQCRFLPTGQDLFYNNRVIKPSHWGPPQQGWWLAAGGMEFCLPVEEHGYVTAEPWAPEVIRHEDGSVTVAMSIEEQSQHVQAGVEVTLRPREAAFHLRMTVNNPGAESRKLQYWVNAMLSPGSPGVQPSLRFYYPASQVIVHSRGDKSLPDAKATMSWPVYAGRDLSRYAEWRNWLGFFAPDLIQPFTAVYDDATQLGIVRIFPPETARGAKLFGFGLEFQDSATYTDDGTQYVEMWGGWTPTFWDYGALGAHSSVSWEETWYVLSRCGGPVVATADGSLSVSRGAQSLDVTVASPGEHHWTLRLAQGSREIVRRSFSVRPDAPFRSSIALSNGDSTGRLTLSVADADGHVLMSCVV